jgi:hypothetical protein
MPGWSVLVLPWKLAVIDSWYRELSYGMSGPSRLALLSNLEYMTYSMSSDHILKANEPTRQCDIYCREISRQMFHHISELPKVHYPN